MTKEQRSKYSHDWDEISLNIRTHRAKNKCEKCSRINGAYYDTESVNSSAFASDKKVEWMHTAKKILHTSERNLYKKLHIIKVILSVHHINQNKLDNSDSNLIAVCQRCHYAMHRDGGFDISTLAGREKAKVQMKLFYD